MSKFDGDLEVGDIVYNSYGKKGYWRITSIEDNIKNGNQYSSYIHLELVMSIDGVPPKKKARTETVLAYSLSKINEENVEAFRKNDNEKWDLLLKSLKPKTKEEIEEEMIEQGIDIPDAEILSIFGPPKSLLKKEG